MSGADGTRRVLRRCGACRLLFEAVEGTTACVVCGAGVAGLELPLARPEAVPTEFTEREPTERVRPREPN